MVRTKTPMVILWEIKLTYYEHVMRAVLEVCSGNSRVGMMLTRHPGGPGSNPGLLLGNVPLLALAILFNHNTLTADGIESNRDQLARYTVTRIHGIFHRLLLLSSLFLF